MAGPWEKYQTQQQPAGPWQKYGSPKAAKPDADTGYDMVRSLGTGVRQGLESIAGAVGDAQQLQGDLAGWVAGKLGMSDENRAKVAEGARYLSPFGRGMTSQSVRETTNELVGDVYEPQTTAGKYARTVGQFLPGAAVGPGGVASRIATQAVIPAVTSEFAGQMTEGSDMEPYARVAGAVAGGVAPAALRRAVTPFPTSQARQNMAKTLADEGVDITAGQRAGSTGLRYAESELGGGTAANMMEKQGEQFTKAALKKAGVTSSRATPEVMDRAFTNIGRRFDDLAARNNIRPDQQFGQDLVDVVTAFRNNVPESTRAPIVENTVKDIITEIRTKPAINGSWYAAQRTALQKAARNQTGGNLEAVQGVREALDNAMERTLNAVNSPDMAVWQETRKQYRNLLAVEDAATRAGEQAAMGIISPSALRGAVVRQGKRAYGRGRGDLAPLARAGEALLKPMPQSGTAPRQAVRNFMTNIPALMGAAPGVAAGDLGMTIAGGAIGAGVPYAAGRAMMSPLGRSYLGNQLLAQTQVAPASRNALVAALLSQQSLQPTGR